MVGYRRIEVKFDSYNCGLKKLASMDPLKNKGNAGRGSTRIMLDRVPAQASGRISG